MYLLEDEFGNVYTEDELYLKNASDMVLPTNSIYVGGDVIINE